MAIYNRQSSITPPLQPETGGAPLGLPPGYRFLPTDVELLDYYLRRKVKGEGFAWWYPMMVEADVYNTHPSSVFDFATVSEGIQYNTTCYVFTHLSKKATNDIDDQNKKKKRKSRTVGDYGTWKEQCSSHVRVQQGLIGYKKYFTFTPSSSSSSNNFIKWQMHEFTLVDYPDFALCRISKKQVPSNNPMSSTHHQHQLPHDQEDEDPLRKQQRLNDSFIPLEAVVLDPPPSSSFHHHQSQEDSTGIVTSHVDRNMSTMISGSGDNLDIVNPENHDDDRFYINELLGLLNGMPLPNDDHSSKLQVDHVIHPQYNNSNSYDNAASIDYKVQRQQDDDAFLVSPTEHQLISSKHYYNGDHDHSDHLRMTISGGIIEDEFNFDLDVDIDVDGLDHDFDILEKLDFPAFP